MDMARSQGNTAASNLYISTDPGFQESEKLTCACERTHENYLDKSEISYPWTQALKTVRTQSAVLKTVSRWKHHYS